MAKQHRQTPIQEHLFSFRDTAYKDFNKKLIPTVDENTMIGIRTPVLKKFAKEFFKADPEQTADFMKNLPHKYFEENNLHAFFIENIKDFDDALLQTEKLLPFIDNWATCDSFNPPLFKKHNDVVYKKILKWIEMLELVSNVRTEEYYVNMMIAWYFSFALIKQYNAAVPYIEKKVLAPFTHNKSIQKAIESKRIPADIKAYLRTLKLKS